MGPCLALPPTTTGQEERVVGSQVIKILLVILKELVCAWGPEGEPDPRGPSS